jgi:hypothetical protein
MYKLEIELGWAEKIIIETDDFNKIAIIQDFIAEQEDCSWGEDELIFIDEDGTSYYYDEELDEWIEVEEEEDEDQE